MMLKLSSVAPAWRTCSPARPGHAQRAQRWVPRRVPGARWGGAGCRLAARRCRCISRCRPRAHQPALQCGPGAAPAHTAANAFSLSSTHPFKVLQRMLRSLAHQERVFQHKRLAAEGRVISRACLSALSEWQLVWRMAVEGGGRQRAWHLNGPTCPEPLMRQQKPPRPQLSSSAAPCSPSPQQPPALQCPQRRNRVPALYLRPANAGTAGRGARAGTH